jgi:dihydroorotase
MRSDVPLRLRGGRLIDPVTGTDRVGDLCLADGIVRGVDLPPATGEQVIDADGCWVTPGFVDLHTHLREPGQAHKETIRTGTRAAAAGGFTTVCAMANTDPVIDTPELVGWVRREAAAAAAIRVVPVAAVTEGLAGRSLAPHGALLAAGARAFSDDGMPLLDPEVVEAALRSTASLGATVSVHAEDTTVGEPGIDRRVAADVGCHGIGAEAESDLIAAHLAVLERVPDARLHVAHLTTAAGVELVRNAKAAGLPVTAEVTPHHLTMTYDRIRSSRFGASGDPFAKVNPPLRSQEDRRALVAGLADGTIDAIATDHAPHAIDEKATTLPAAPSGLIGLELVVPAVCQLVDEEALPVSRAIASLTAAAAACFGLSQHGFRPGAVADVAVVDPAATWPVTASTLRSRGVNTPHLGATLRGMVRMTIHRGARVHLGDEELPCA